MALNGNVITGELTAVGPGAYYICATLAEEFSDLMFVEDERGEPDEDDLVTMIFVRYKTSSDEITAFNGLTANIDGILVNALMFTGSAMGYLPEDTSAIESMELVYYAIPAGDAMTLITSVMQNGPVVDLTGYEQVGCAYDITSFKDTFFPST